jgi:predicted RNase H-like HicB family nuclease
MSDINGYPYEIAPLPDEEGGGYVVSFVDIPGCIGVGDTQEEAIEDGGLAVIAALDALKGVDRKPPKSSLPQPAPQT